MNKNKIIIGCDLHNTLLLSNEAWIKAYLHYNCNIDKDQLAKSIYNKESRKEISKKYNIDYEMVKNKYHENCKPNIKLIMFIKMLKELNIPVLLISSSNKEKVDKDLLKLKNYIVFDKVYTKENFKKDNMKDWNRIIKENKADLMIYIGNDYDEDIIKNDKVVSILSGHFFKELKDVGILKERGKK